MSWTQSDIDAIDVALRRGTRSVTFPNGQSVSYSTTEEMMKVRSLAITEVSKEIAAARGHTAPYSLAEFGE